MELGVVVRVCIVSMYIESICRVEIRFQLKITNRAQFIPNFDGSDILGLPGFQDRPNPCLHNRGFSDRFATPHLFIFFCPLHSFLALVKNVMVARAFFFTRFAFCRKYRTRLAISYCFTLGIRYIVVVYCTRPARIELVTADS